MPKRFVVIPTGDSIVSRRVPLSTAPLAELRRILSGADVAFTNLEIVLNAHRGFPSDQLNLSADPAVAGYLKELGFHLVGCANNHTLNYGIRGVLATIEALQRADLAFAGAGRDLHEARRPAYLETAAGRVALIAASSTFARGQQATGRRADAPGRPGLNPLRFETTYTVDHEAFLQLGRVAEHTGLGDARLRAVARGTARAAEAGTLSLLGATFGEGSAFDVASVPHAHDLAEHERWIHNARRFADLVLMSVHCHELEEDRSIPPDFLVTFAHAAIDAGADLFIGHGPHALRGLELYRGKPIFYSLSDFFYEAEYATQLPGDNYVTSAMHDWTPAEFHEHYTAGGTKGSSIDRRIWESVLPTCTFEDGRLVRLELRPLTLGFGRPLPERGTPALASGDEARATLAYYAALSAPFGTRLRIEGERAVVDLT